MNSIRIHAADQGSSGQIDYMLLTFVDGARVQIDLSYLRGFANGTNVAMSQAALYELLQGKDLILSLDSGTINFLPRETELILSLRGVKGEHLSEHRVWLSEIALGWNLLAHTSFPA